MFGAFLILIGCQLVGEFAADALHLPIPGPVVGLFALAATLALRGRGHSDHSASKSIPLGLEQTSEALIGLMGVLFVPAGVGIIAEAHLLKEEWLPILAAVLGSTILSVAVTGAVMHWTLRASEMREAHGGA